MTYTTHIFEANNGSERIPVKAKVLGEFDRALFEQDARITALEVSVADLLARVIVLENA